ncbi:MAG: hypothetical protein IKM18_07060, partial [Clostridia bacterium]|nr:hypothetical protein [Clostridia bacterium]
VGMSLEDIFITVVDKNADEQTLRGNKYERQTRKRRGGASIESEIAENLYRDAERRREEQSESDAQ